MVLPDKEAGCGGECNRTLDSQTLTVTASSVISNGIVNCFQEVQEIFLLSYREGLANVSASGPLSASEQNTHMQPRPAKTYIAAFRILETSLCVSIST